MRAGTIARATIREGLHLPVVHLLVIGAAVLVAIAGQLPRFTMSMSDDMKMLKDLALATATLAGLLSAVFVAVNVITAEMENWTVVTLLSKPVRRWEFVAGKWLGVVGLTLAVFAVLAVLVIPAVWWGMWSYAKEWSNIEPEFQAQFWTSAWDAANELARGMAMSFFQVVALTGIVTALCVRASAVVSATSAVALFVAGNLVSAAEHAGAGAASWAKALAALAVLVVPDQAAIAFSPEAAASDARMPVAAVAWAGAYALCLALAGVVAGVVLFRRREVM